MLSGNSQPPACPIIPLPTKVVCSPLSEPAETSARLCFEGPEDIRISARFDELLADSNCGTVVVQLAQAGAAWPSLESNESYSLRTGSEGTQLRASDTWGALHGLTTLAQLQQAGALDGRQWLIEDAPRFVWRGLCLDVARHFYSLQSLHQVVDGLAWLKMNVLHLHLSDDQAFRWRGARFPELASAQHYTSEQLRALVGYAADRGVRVVPELDVPGHTTSWLVSHPEWGLQPVGPSNRFGVHEACLNAADEMVYRALSDLFTELVQIFPDPFVHIGGDEVSPVWWRGSQAVQRFIDEQDLDDEKGLQAYFNRRMAQLLGTLGRHPVGWDEVLHEQMPAMLIQNWRGATTRDRALAAGMDCIVSAGFYLDLFYPADVHYRYDPTMPQEDLVGLENSLRQDQRLLHVARGMAWTDQWRAGAVAAPQSAARVLGGEACLWSELVDDATWPTRLWSRLPAVAERLWSEPEVDDIADFYARLEPTLQREPFQLPRRQQRSLTALGLSLPQSDAAGMLEPVKWYARLLGEQALQARLAGSEMPQARPYHADTPLNRIVDFINPESMAARALATLQEADLRTVAETWRALDASTWPADVRGAIAALVALGDALSDLLAGKMGAVQFRLDAQGLYGPHGEYMLAPVPILCARFGDGADDR